MYCTRIRDIYLSRKRYVLRCYKVLKALNLSCDNLSFSMHTVIMQIILDGMYSQQIVDCFSRQTKENCWYYSKRQQVVIKHVGIPTNEPVTILHIISKPTGH